MKTSLTPFARLHTTCILLLPIFCLLITSCEDEEPPDIIDPPPLPPEPPFDFGVIWMPLLIIAILACAFFIIKRIYKKCQEQERMKKQQERMEQHKQSVLKSAWWNLPSGSIIVFDTCVLMQDSNRLTAWMKWIASNAAAQNWKIHIIKHVYKEIREHQRNGDEAQKYGAREALRRIELMQKIAGAHISVGCEGKLPDTKADDPLRDYICLHKQAILFTDDRDLGIRVREAQCAERLKMWNDFKPYPGNM